MSTLLFVTKPQFAPERVKAERGILWSCSRETRAGDQALVYVTGEGISYRWRAISDAEPSGRTAERPWPYACHVEYVDTFAPPVTAKELRDAIPQEEWNAPHAHIRVKAASVILSGVAERIIALRSMLSLREVEERFSKDVAASLKLPPGKRLEQLASAPKLPTKVKVTTEVFLRNEHVVAQVLIRAAGHCEFCKSPAPFAKATDGTPYLEVHHQKWLAAGGEDTVQNAVALCPNCHRKAHYG